MTDIVMMFEVHQPYRLDRNAHAKLLERALSGRIEYRDLEEAIFDNPLNKLVMERAGDRCYIPATKIIVENIKRAKEYGKDFKVSFSISGVLLEQAEKWRPDILEAFREAAETGSVEFLAQTYYHSMVAFMPFYGFEELGEQIDEQRKIVREKIGYEPSAAENTEFTYNNDIACFLYSMGFRAIMTEGVDWVLGWRSPNYVYKGRDCDIRVFTRNYKLSDDIGFRFSDRKWDQYPLTADKYAAWLSSTPGDVIFIAVDYETFGEHHWPETGIHEFLRWLPHEVLKYHWLAFSTPSEVINKYPPRDIYDVPPWSTISWADERDLSAWLGNNMQLTAFNMLADLRPYVKALNDPELLRIWRLLTISDHLYYIATKFGTIEEVHSYFSPYKNATAAFGLLVEAVGALATLVADRISKNAKRVLERLEVPPHKSFYFRYPTGEYTGVYANSLRSFLVALDAAPPESFLYHLNRGDLESWLSNVFFLEEAARELREARSAPASYEELLAKVKDVIRRALA